MMVVSLDEGKPLEVVDYSIGHGSKSDQGGMNRLFRALNAPYYYSRKGSANIEETTLVSVEHVLQHWPIKVYAG